MLKVTQHHRTPSAQPDPGPDASRHRSKGTTASGVALGHRPEGGAGGSREDAAQPNHVRGLGRGQP